MSIIDVRGILTCSGMTFRQNMLLLRSLSHQLLLLLQQLLLQN